MNPAAEELLGYSPEERQKSLAERLALLHVETLDGQPFPPEDTAVALALRGETVRGTMMIVHRRSDGKPIRVSMSAAPIRTSDNQQLGAVAIFTDVTRLSAWSKG